MVEAVPQAEALPTGENGRTRKCFGLCEICEAQHGHAGVNKNPAKSLGEKELAPHEARNITLSRNGKLLKGKGEEQAMEDDS